MSYTIYYHICLRSEERSAMNISQIAEAEKKRLLKEKKRLEKLLCEAPEGKLVYSTSRSKGRSYYKWFVSLVRAGKKVQVYIPSSNRKFAAALARKYFYQKKLDDVLCELRALDSYLGKHRGAADLERLVSTPALGSLLTEEELELVPDLPEELVKWAKADYEHNPKHPERLTVKTPDGNFVRSKSEAMIYTLLLGYKFPFRYECRLDVGGYVFYPDFTIRHPVTGEVIYWEHVGMLDDPVKAAKFIFKLRIYIRNGIYPDHNLILTFESGGHPLDFSIVQDKFKEFFSCGGVML